LIFITTLLPVLHPPHKLAYFTNAGWEPEWVETAWDIICAEFDPSYADKVGKNADKGTEQAEKPTMSHDYLFDHLLIPWKPVVSQYL
jgi:hypothetical protein